MLSLTRVPRLTVALLLCASTSAAFLASSAQAQVIERNLPPPAQGDGGVVLAPEQLGASRDATPLGVTVSGIRLIGPKEQVEASPPTGVTISAIGAMSAERVAGPLSNYIGQPLSAKLIGDMQAAIARVYREAGYPFVAITLPVQEVTSGVVQLQVSEFRYGKVTTNGAKAGSEDGVLSQVRTADGGRIRADLLEEDLDWLNRYPYRSVQGVFSPGDQAGETALTLEVAPRKPWEIFAGWSNTGTGATGRQRYFAGFGAGMPSLGNSFLSYQATGSDDFWSAPGSIASGASSPRYFSQAARLVMPLAARQSLEIAPNYVATRQNGDPATFAFTNEVLEIPVIYRTALSNILPGTYLGDLMIGAVGRHVSRRSYFDGTDIGGANADQFELVFGWAMNRADAHGRTTVLARVVGNPGGVLGGNSAANWNAYSSGRVDRANYAYATLDLGRLTRLPGGLAYVTQFSGLLGTRTLPDTSQLAIGGMSATRGYVLEDASVDRGFYWRNEVCLPSFSLFGRNMAGGFKDDLSPYGFLDLGFGYNYGYDGLLGHVEAEKSSLAGIGAGLDYRHGSHVQASLAAGHALSSARETRAGDWTVQARLFLSY
ncbi:hypothetical protein SZ64_10500 [Erythrobacter sp. SG61-1L]|nr:hypothetical protein SZ64_10500 [Erythrobacter sp. SG61-1L]